MTPTDQPQLQLDRVSLTDRHGLHTLLKDISWRINAGDRWGVMGPSGAGKTSLLRLLNRLSEPTSGEITLNGRTLQDLPSHHVRQQVVLVPQEPKLLGMTVQETLTYPLRLRGLTAANIQGCLAQIIEQCHIPPDWLTRTEQQLSVGQRQWVAIARALILSPEILVLDEPTSALDRGRVDFLVTVLGQYPQTTLILVSHQLALIRQVCDHLLYLERGRVTQTLEAAAINWEQLQATLQQQQDFLVSEWG